MINAISKRGVEEIMLKLLLNQFNEKDIRIIIDQKSMLLWGNTSAVNFYFKKHIHPYCENNILKLLNKINNQEIRKKFLTKFNQCLFEELEREIKALYNDQKYQHIPTDLVVIFLVNIEYSIDYMHYEINEVKGIKLIWNILCKGDIENEQEIIFFINKVFIKSNTKNKQALVFQIMKKIKKCDKSKQEMLLDQLVLKNQMNGVPGIELIRQETKNNITVRVNTDQNEIINIDNLHFSITLFNLLIQIIVTCHINVDVYQLKYVINKNETKNIINCSPINYLKPLDQVFKNSSPQNDISITIYYETSNEISNENLYFTKSNIRKDIRIKLQKLFKGQEYVDVDLLFSYLNNKQLREKINSVFKKNKYLRFEALIAYLEYKTEECYLLLHLLIGFHDNEINKPYLRNIFPEDMICIEIVKYKHILDWKPKQELKVIKENNPKFEIVNKDSFEGSKKEDWEIIDINQYTGKLFKKIKCVFQQTKCLNDKEQYLNVIHSSYNVIENITNEKELVSMKLFFDRKKKDINQSINEFFNDYLVHINKNAQTNSSEVLIISLFCMIDHFLKYPFNYSSIIGNKKYQILLLLLISQNTTLERNTIAFVIIFTFYNTNHYLSDTLFGIITTLTNLNTKISLHLSLNNKHGNSLFELTNKVKDPNEKHWQFNAILIQLFNLNHYINYTENNIGLSLFYLRNNILLDIEYTSHYTKVEETLNLFENKCSSNTITELLLQINPQLTNLDDNSQQYSSFCYSTKKIKKINLILIGCITIVSQPKEIICSYCINMYNKRQIEKYYFSSDIHHYPTFSIPFQEHQRTIYFYLNSQYISKFTESDLIQNLKIDNYPLIYLALLNNMPQPITKVSFDIFLDTYKKMIQNGQLTTENLNELYSSKIYNTNVQEFISNLLQK